MTPLTRRMLVAGATTAAGASCARSRAPRRHDAIVVGAGVFGACTAEHLRRAGQSVLLVDEMGPANGRASSGVKAA